MKIFITGSESFIGSCFWELAQNAGHEVTGLDVAPIRKAGSVQIDLRAPDVAAYLPEGCAVVHLAALSTDTQCKSDPLEAMAVNVGGSIALAQAARNRKCCQFLFASSEWVYGEVSNDAIQLEDQPIDIARNPSVYAFTKYTGERILMMSDLPNVTILRFGIVYGPRGQNWSAVEKLLDAVRREEPIKVGSLQTARRFILVQDLCEGILASLGQKGKEIFNLSGERLVTLGEIVETSQAYLGNKVNVSETNPSSVSIRNPDNSKAQQVLGWRPRTPFKTGLAKVCSFLEGPDRHD